MVDIELELLTDDKVSYRYYPEGREEYGIVSLNRKTGERILDMPCPNSISMYANHAWLLLEKYQSRNRFPEKGWTMWY